MDTIGKEIQRRHVKSSRIRYLRIFDTFLGLVVKSITRSKIGRCNKVLLSNLGDIGDVIISTSTIPVLKAAFPNIAIGYLIKPYTRSVIQDHPDVSWIHTFDKWPNHIYLTIRDPTHIGTFTNLIRDSMELGKSLSGFDYDVAIDLRSFFPNSVVALWKAKIPVRIGYDRAGFSPLLTHVVKYPFTRQHESAYQLGLCSQLPSVESSERVTFSLPALYHYNGAELFSLFEKIGGFRKFRVVHTGSSQVSRDWPESYWRQLSELLVKNDHLLVFTGKGERDSNRIQRIIHNLPNCINACNKLSYHGLVNAIKHAELVYSVETAAGHIAAATDTPVVWIHSGITDVKQWAPLSSKCKILAPNLVCSPCYRQGGCHSMRCMWEIDPLEVYGAGEALMDDLR